MTSLLDHPIVVVTFEVGCIVSNEAIVRISSSINHLLKTFTANGKIEIAPSSICSCDSVFLANVVVRLLLQVCYDDSLIASRTTLLTCEIKVHKGMVQTRDTILPLNYMFPNEQPSDKML